MKKNKILNFNIIYNNAIPYILSIYFLSLMLSNSTIYNFTLANSIIHATIRFCILIAFGLAVTKIVFSPFKLYMKAIFVLIIALSMYNYIFITKNGGFLIILFYIIICSEIKNIDKFFLFFIIYSLIGFIIILTCRFSNIIPDATVVQIRNNIEKNRYSLGFNYANSGPHYFFLLTMYYIYIKKNKINNIMLLIFVVANYIFYYFTDTKNRFFCGMLIIIFTLFIKYNKNNTLFKLYDFITCIIFPFSFFLLIILLILYKCKISFSLVLNNILSGRLKLSIEAIENIGITILGKNVRNYIPSEYFWLDSGYLSCLIYNGIILFTIFLSLYTILCISSAKIKDRYMSMCLIISAYHSMFDASFDMINFSPFIIFFFPYLITAYPNLKKYIFYNNT